MKLKLTTILMLVAFTGFCQKARFDQILGDAMIETNGLSASVLEGYSTTNDTIAVSNIAVSAKSQAEANSVTGALNTAEIASNTASNSLDAAHRASTSNPHSTSLATAFDAGDFDGDETIVPFRIGARKYGRSAGDNDIGNNSYQLGYYAGLNNAANYAYAFGSYSGFYNTNDFSIFIDTYLDESYGYANENAFTLIDGHLCLGRTGFFTNSLPNKLRGNWENDAGDRLSNLSYKVDVTDGTATNLTIGDKLNFSPHAETGSEAIGTLFRDSTTDALKYQIDDDGNITIGEEMFRRLTNLSGTTLSNGCVVSIVGASGNRSAVTRTDITVSTNALACVGLVTVHDILNNQPGRITVKGPVQDINTSHLVEGMPVYASITNGATVSYMPDASNYVVRIGMCTVSHATQGIIDVDVNVYPKPQDLSGVNGTALTEDGQAFGYSSSIDAMDALYNFNDYPTYIATSNIVDSALAQTRIFATTNSSIYGDGYTFAETGPGGAGTIPFTGAVNEQYIATFFDFDETREIRDGKYISHFHYDYTARSNPLAEPYIKAELYWINLVSGETNEIDVASQVNLVYNEGIKYGDSELFVADPIESTTNLIKMVRYKLFVNGGYNVTGNIYVGNGYQSYLEYPLSAFQTVRQSDLIASKITYTPPSGTTATTVQDALDEQYSADATPYAITAVNGTATVDRANGILQSLAPSTDVTINVIAGSAIYDSQVNLVVSNYTHYIDYTVNATNICSGLSDISMTNLTTVLFYSPMFTNVWESSLYYGGE